LLKPLRHPSATARKLRLEFPGACYHVINRGYYRADLFKTRKTKALGTGRPVYLNRLVPAARHEQPQ
jgi:hypothetical protein